MKLKYVYGGSYYYYWSKQFKCMVGFTPYRTSTCFYVQIRIPGNSEFFYTYHKNWTEFKKTISKSPGLPAHKIGKFYE